MIRRAPGSTRTDTLFPYTTLFRSLDRLDQLFFLDQHRLGHVAGGELDLVEGLQIGRVRDGNEGFLAALEQWQCMNLAQHLVADFAGDRSEERRVGKACVSTCRSRWSPYH